MDIFLSPSSTKMQGRLHTWQIMPANHNCLYPSTLTPNLLFPYLLISKEPSAKFSLTISKQQISSKFCRWMINMLITRVINFTIEESNVKRQVSKRSITPGLEWCLVVDSLLMLLNKTFSKCLVRSSVEQTNAVRIMV